MNNRIRKLRNELGLNQRDFAKRIDVGASTLAMFETGDRVPKDIHINRICQEFGANEKWLRTGNGEMFLSPEDEVAEQVSHLLEESNPFYNLILDTMKVYDQLDEKGKLVICEAAQKLADEIAKRKKED